MDYGASREAKRCRPISKGTFKYLADSRRSILHSAALRTSYKKMGSLNSNDLDGPSPASIILQHIPETERSSFIKSSIRCLRHEDHSDINFVASLIQHSDNPTAKEDLLSFLQRSIEARHVENAVSISLKHVDLGSELLARATDSVYQASLRSSDESFSDETVQLYLKFSKLTALYLPVNTTQTRLFQACLDILGSANSHLNMEVRDVLFELLVSRSEPVAKEVVEPNEQRIWQTVRRVIDSKQHTMLGYSLWLRWILAIHNENLEKFTSDEYWELILQGLRHGDTERRKLCLNILKTTTTVEIGAVSNDVRRQFDRYCTVFETIVLGRYINQVQECEQDLDFLAAQSSLDPKWLYTLLSSALDARMQDSNRRFIGNWIMRSALTPGPEFLRFFQDVFLPWAIHGQLFVSSLKSDNGLVRCAHGERLAAFIKRLRHDCSDQSEVVDSVVKIILRKRNSMFAYCTVYLLEGLENSLTTSHKEELSGISGLPEVARDYVSLKISNSSRLDGDKSSISRREAMEQETFEKIRTMEPTVESLQAIWTDLDYLEFPKRLLMAIPEVILQPRVMDDAANNPTMAESIRDMLRTLQRITETKTFLFAPLVTAIRQVVMATPSAIEVLELDQFLVRVAEHPPEPTIDLMLEEATIDLTPYNYEHYFGDRPSVGFAACLDLISRQQQNQSLVATVLEQVFRPWKNQKPPVPTVSPWKTKLELQMLLLCLEQHNPSADDIQQLLEDLFRVLAIEPLPSLRYMLEWIVIRMIVRFDLRDALISRLQSKDHHSNPKHLASLMKIGAILVSTPESGESFATQVATTFVPLAASSKIVIRHEAQWQVPILMDHARERGWHSIVNNTAMAALDDYIRSLERFHDPPLERRIGRFDPAADHTLVNLVEGVWFDLDQTEAPRASYGDFIKLYSKYECPPRTPETCIPLGSEIDRPPKPSEPQPEAPEGKLALAPRTADDVIALQTKGTAYLSRTLSSPSSHATRPNNLIVVGSLVDNPYNLGGLSRVSEIFGASALTLQNQNVVSNKDFTSVSVSSHLHFPIVQLSAPAIADFLAERKREGFTVVGIEQTDRSVVLGSDEAKLPEKVVLVVGSEKEGIPAKVLTECDILVEIPQKGVTRSLNVQTAVSIVLFEYERQHGQRKE